MADPVGLIERCHFMEVSSGCCDGFLFDLLPAQYCTAALISTGTSEQHCQRKLNDDQELHSRELFGHFKVRSCQVHAFEIMLPQLPKRQSSYPATDSIPLYLIESA